MGKGGARRPTRRAGSRKTDGADAADAVGNQVAQLRMSKSAEYDDFENPLSGNVSLGAIGCMLLSTQLH